MSMYSFHPRKSAARAIRVSICGALLATTAAFAATPAAAEPRQGGTVTIAVPFFPVCLDPSLSQGRQSVATYQIIDTLTDQDEAGEIVPGIAEKWDIGDGYKQFTFHLKKGVTFSDGTPLDAEAAALTFTTLKAIIGTGQADPLSQNALASFVEAKALDEHTLRLTFAHPELGFLRNASDPYLGLYARSTLAKSVAERCAGNLVGSGPFVIQSVAKNQEIVLANRQDYNWPPAVAHHSGRAYLDKVIFRVVPESGVRVGGVGSGEFDLADELLVTDISQAEATGGKIVVGVVPNLVPGISQNPFSPLGGDPAVLAALQKGVDRKEITDTLYDGVYALPTSIVASNTSLWVDLSKELAYDPEGARKTLDDAGWRLGTDGIREKDGVKLQGKFTFIVGNSFGATQEELELVKQQLARIGFGVTIIPVTQAEHGANLKNKKNVPAPYDFLSGSGASKDIDFLAGLFMKSNIRLDGADQPGLEERAQALKTASTPEARTAAAAELQRFVAIGGYWVPLREQTRIVGVNPVVQDYKLDGYAAHDFYDVWLSR
ncbi:ABC transporter substrate-binding protein [Rhizobium puerariae]|uniref:ABC transporter substrate-binding protein n=1 Tax=Rhizobium puerariae TaxID=1585791 RepID=A0ABV6ADJ7_9HYPH